MKRLIVVLFFIVTSGLISCKPEVDLVSSATVKDEEKSVVVISKAEDLLLKELQGNLDGLEELDDIKLVFDSNSHVVLTINQSQKIVGNDIEHIIRKETEKTSNYDMRLVEDKLFVINEFDDKKQSGVKIVCYEYDGSAINEVWSSKRKPDINFTDQETIIVSESHYTKELVLKDEWLQEIDSKKSCKMRANTDFVFEDIDGDGYLNLYVEGQLSLCEGLDKPFYKIYEISESINLINCGFLEESN